MPGNKPNRRKLKRSATRKQAKPPQARPPADRRALERETWEIGRLVQEQNLESIDELNAFVQATVNKGQVIRTVKSTPLDQAQDLMYQAWDSRGKRRLARARQALDISKDCADAYVLLAEEAAESINEARYFYEQGVKAGERALGEEVFREDVGHFWGIVETRPYMRARKGLAECLWTLGERQQAVDHFQELLRLNPGDNQGVRYILVSFLLLEDRGEEVEALLKAYPGDPTAAWTYSKAILSFRKNGRGRSSTLAVRKAFRSNPYVPFYLLGLKKPPRRMPEYIGIGDESEAVDYVSLAQDVWLDTESALEWLADSMLRMPVPKAKTEPNRPTKRRS